MQRWEQFVKTTLPSVGIMDTVPQAYHYCLLKFSVRPGDLWSLQRPLQDISIHKITIIIIITLLPSGISISQLLDSYSIQFPQFAGYKMTSIMAVWWFYMQCSLRARRSHTRFPAYIDWDFPEHVQLQSFWTDRQSSCQTQSQNIEQIVI